MLNVVLPETINQYRDQHLYVGFATWEARWAQFNIIAKINEFD
jgi:hypothetical protein